MFNFFEVRLTKYGGPSITPNTFVVQIVKFQDELGRRVLL